MLIFEQILFILSCFVVLESGVMLGFLLYDMIKDKDLDWTPLAIYYIILMLILGYPVIHYGFPTEEGRKKTVTYMIKCVETDL